VKAWNAGAGYLPAGGSGKHTHLNGGQGLVNANAPADAGTVFETGWIGSDDTQIQPTDANLTVDSNSTWTAAVGSATAEKLPINTVDWWEAYAFCIWDGGFLPSDAEWEYVAAHGSEEREYPWGSTDPGTANAYAVYGCNYGGGAGTCSAGTVNIAPVGSATSGAGYWGQLDMAGEVLEWNLDFFAPYVNPCTDCSNLVQPASVSKSNNGRIVRGGDYISTSLTLMEPEVRSSNGEGRDESRGFRCARTP
jgi:formylglycine-generating enzyme